ETEYSIDKRYLRKDGTIIWTTINSAPIRNESGQIVSLITVIQGISDRMASAEDLQHSLSLLHAALESTADGILVVDISGRIARYNQVFLRLWHIPDQVIAHKDDEMTLKYVLDQIKHPRQFLEKVRELYASPEAESYDVVQLKDGRVFER